MNASIVATENGRTITNPDAETLSRWALAAHNRECRECGSPTSDSRCPAGEQYEAATRTDRSWIPTVETET